MDYDIDRPFCEIYRGVRKFRKDLRKAINTQYEREDKAVWAENLQFLTIYTSEDTPTKVGEGRYHNKSHNIHDCPDHELFLPKGLAHLSTANCGRPDLPCRCASYEGFDGIFTRSIERKTLRLTSIGELQGCTHFLAVSYRWPQEDISDEERYDIILPSGKRRKSNVPAWLLDRIIDYAVSQGVKFIWIDQECVDQNSEQLKQAVQAYHAVYRQSQQVVGVLTTAITNQSFLDAFKCAEKYYGE
ncbi:hypothetical protein F5884DRAFT_544545 [Xylogone sp. PMI_703]|nr:hypothetical protein F5884DRAFT_544545 [Xylogone sp. PMI_703]